MTKQLKDDLDILNTPEDAIAQALTHRSRSRKHNNERLEFLGDAALELAVTEMLVQMHPEASEGQLSVLRTHLVREETLAEVAREHHIGEHLILGRGEAASGGSDKDSLLADATEAIIGAVFLHEGYGQAGKLVEKLLRGRAENASADNDPKTALQERASEMGLPAPRYNHVQEGPEHSPLFSAEVHVGNRATGRGQGTSRKRAEQQAAREALEMLRSRWDER